jgi:extracellular factor (EF) 3-hydroxypalmitic acid methyl ester biosynthesis protein
MGLFYQSVRPGGLVLSTNVAPTCPNRGSLELVLDWHLIYRNAREMENIWPREISPDPARIESDETFVNVFLEARKPNAT